MLGVMEPKNLEIADLLIGSKCVYLKRSAKFLSFTLETCMVTWMARLCIPLYLPR